MFPALRKRLAFALHGLRQKGVLGKQQRPRFDGVSDDFSLACSAFVVNSIALFQPGQQRAQTARRQADARISRAVIQMNRVAVRRNRDRKSVV